jgi:hypothetical protein
VARHLLGDFGRGMSDGELGTALAGELTQRPECPWPPTRRGRLLTATWWSPFFIPTLGDASEAAARWRARAGPLAYENQASRHGIALELAAEAWPWRQAEVDVAWFARILGSGEFVSAVHYVTARAHPTAEWLWPLDVGLYDDAASRTLRTVIQQLHWHRFVTPVSAERATSPIELLVLPYTLREALARILAESPLPRVQAVLVLGGHATAPNPVEVCDLLRRYARADAVCVMHISPSRQGAFLDSVLVELSHDLDLDVAVAAACRNGGAPPPLVVAAEGAFARAHLSVWGRRVGTRVARTPKLVVPPLRFSVERFAPSIGHELVGRITDFRFDSERNEASDIAELGHAARAEPPAVGSRERFVQAELFDGSGPAVARIEQGPLVAGEYRLEVWVGPPRTGALIAPVTLPELPSVPDGHTLTVVFTAPALDSEPQVRGLVLPPVGASDRVYFAFRIREGLGRLEARISVLYENRVLQTLLLAADVGVGKATRLTLALEAIVRRDLDGIAGRRPFDAAVITNRLASQRTLSVFAGEHVSLVPAGGSIAQLTQEVSALLENATNNAKKYGKPDSPGTSDLLSGLARKGVLLRDALLDMPRVRNDLAEAKRIQIIAATLDEPTLPIEICYDGVAPGEGAVTCPQWEAALSAGACQPACPNDRGSVVCPVAFWGTSRSIERHAYAKVDAQHLGAAAYALQSEPAEGRKRLPLVQGSLCAAADAARAVDAAAVDLAFADAGKLAEPNAEVKDWAAWRQAIAQNPSVLLLLAHTDQKEGMRTLVIGAKDTAFITSVDASYVGGGGGQGPVVLLLGCSTGIAELAFQSVVARFCRGGASIVIGTLCEILGQQAAPIASEILGELKRVAAASEGTPLGDLVPALRRRLLARGYPIVMAIAPYGDADWCI